MFIILHSKYFCLSGPMKANKSFSNHTFIIKLDSNYDILFVYCCESGTVSLTGPKVIKLLSCSTQLSTKFILPINVEMPTIVGILTFISMINATSERLIKQETSS